MQSDKLILLYSKRLTMKEHNPHSQSRKPRSWWQTDCVKCQRMRMIVLWAIIVFVVYFYVWT